MECINCGRQLRDDTLYCNECGTWQGSKERLKMAQAGRVDEPAYIPPMQAVYPQEPQVIPPVPPYIPPEPRFR